MNWSLQRLHTIWIIILQLGPVARLTFSNLYGPYILIHNVLLSMA